MIVSMFLSIGIVSNRFFDFLDTSSESMYQEIDEYPYAHPAQNEDHHKGEEDWELSKIGLPEGSNLSGIKALLEDYPEDEAHSKKIKKTNTGKGKKSTSKIKK